MKNLFLLLLLTGSLWASAQPGNLHEFDLKRLQARHADQSELRFCPALGSEALLFQPTDNQRFLKLAGVDEKVPWEKAKYLVLDVWHDRPFSDVVHLDFYQQAETQRDPASKARQSVRTGVLPLLPTQIVLPLAYLDGQRIYLPKMPRQLKAKILGYRMEASEIDHVRIRVNPVQKPAYQASLYIRRMYLTEQMPLPLPTPEKPVVDRLGQWNARTWPGKTRSEADLVQQLKADLTTMEGQPMADGLSQYGGYKARKFAGTGFFRTHHDGQRWWLADPEGYAFLSVGVDVIQPSAAGTAEGMNDLFEWLPAPTDTTYGAVDRTGIPLKSIDFLQINLKKAFGSRWRERWETLTAGQMRAWQFNTVANWSDKAFAQKARIPYVINMGGFPTTPVKLFRDFPDVFDPAYAQRAHQFAQQLEATKNDPFVIGYFLSNEPNWAFGDHILAWEMMATPVPSFTKKALIVYLKDKYRTLDSFNRAWNLSLPSIDTLETTVLRDQSALTADATADCKAFSNRMMEQYIKTICDEVKRVDANHLNLGLRYAYISSDLCYQAGAYVDVFSINGYSTPAPPPTAEITRRSGKPVMIGEFHFGATDRGLPATGVRGANSQAERGKAYRYYVEQGLARPELIGVHYFQWNDQPVLGRGDGENYNIGLVDVCNRPYAEFVKAARQTNKRMYPVALKQVPPYRKIIAKAPDIYY